jgi:UDP-N-acetylmuramoyl-tripeptide--D-alanyl-D-alanine ligase
LDAYNANPSSVEAGLKSFSTLEGKKIVLLGDMLELGESAYTEHKAIFELTQSLNIDEAIFVGEHFYEAVGNYPMKFSTADTLLAWLDTHPIECNYVYIKGSRGIKMEKCLEHFKVKD